MALLVLLHGFAGAPAAWDEVLARLGSHRAVRPTLLGHDRADGPAPGSFDEAVNALAAELGQAGVTRDAHLCGYSLGARMGLGLLVRHRSLFAGATLIGLHPGLDDASRPARADADERWATMLERDGLERFLAAWEEQALFASQRGLPAAVLDAQRAWRRALRPRGLALSLRCVGLARMPSYWASLTDLDLPVRLVVGERDEKFRGLAERACGVLPRGHLSVIPACGHNLVLESPGAVARFLSSEE